ncbi:hypothetical protein H0H92_006514 [Tricholoma furcatifolium]|nr:hypothetical protein H0H92_006514 [Tricholoma furcatifolium]
MDFSGSQETLVNPNSFRIDANKKSLLNTVFSSKGRPVYAVVTTYSPSAGDHTYFKDAETGRVLATITRRSILADTLTFADYYDGKAIHVNKWVVWAKKDGKETGVIDIAEGRFIWKADELHRFRLYSESDEQTPLAYEVLAPQTPVGLVMEPGTEHYRLQILVSYFIMEQKLRSTGTGWGAGTGGVASGVKGYYE